MKSTFELQINAVRDHLEKMVAQCHSTHLTETLTGRFRNFVQFEVRGSPGTADFVITVDPAIEHFSFSVGEHIRYEGDYDTLPPTLDYFQDLVDAVLQGHVYETHCYLISPQISSVAKVLGKIPLARHDAFEFTQQFSFLSLLARRQVLRRYRPFERRLESQSTRCERSGL